MQTICAERVRNKFIRKCCITLLEVLIALAVVAMVGGVVAWNIRKLYLQQQTLDEMQRVALLLRKSQELMMMAHLDSEISFKPEENHLRATLIPKSGVSPLMQPLLLNTSFLMTHLDTITFEDAFQETVLSQDFSLTFVSQGFLMNRGVLQMRGNDVTRSIIIHGYPSAVVLLEGEKVFFPYSNELVDEMQQIMEQTALETPIDT